MSRENRRRASVCAWVIVTVLAGGAWAQYSSGVLQWVSVRLEATGDNSNKRDKRAIRNPDYYLSARPEHVVWGGFPIDHAPLLTIRSGDTVRIDTISQSGATNATLNPVQYFGQFGVKPWEVLQDVSDFWVSRPGRPQYGPHILTGPVYVEGAEPGDTLEIEILDLGPRVPYGLNNTSPMGGVLGTGYPGYRPGDPGLDIPEAPPGAPAGIFPIASITNPDA